MHRPSASTPRRGTPARASQEFSLVVGALDLGLLVVAFGVAHALRFPWEGSSLTTNPGWTEVVTAPAIILL